MIIGVSKDTLGDLKVLGGESGTRPNAATLMTKIESAQSR